MVEIAVSTEARIASYLFLANDTSVHNIATSGYVL